MAALGLISMLAALLCPAGVLAASGGVCVASIGGAILSGRRLRRPDGGR
jgi:hypothetical protein